MPKIIKIKGFLAPTNADKYEPMSDLQINTDVITSIREKKVIVYKTDPGSSEKIANGYKSKKEFLEQNNQWSEASAMEKTLTIIGIKAEFNNIYTTYSIDELVDLINSQ